MSLKVKDRDRGYRKLIKDLAGVELTIGVQGEDAEKPHPSSELTVGELAAIHELGLGVPERSWLRSWVDKNQALMEADLAIAWRRIAGGESRRKVMNEVGAKWVLDIQEGIISGEITPALAPSTIAQKGFDTPLVDTMTFVTSISHSLKLLAIKSIKSRAVREVLRSR